MGTTPDTYWEDRAAELEREAARVDWLADKIRDRMETGLPKNRPARAEAVQRLGAVADRLRNRAADCQQRARESR